MRCFVSESQRGDMAPGEVSAFEGRREVEESVRMVEMVVEMELSRRNALRGRMVVVFMVQLSCVDSWSWQERKGDEW